MEENNKVEEEFLLPEEGEDFEIETNTGEKDEDVYSEEGRESLNEDDEIENWEDGFCEGAEGLDEKGSEGSCAFCGKILGDREEGVIEREIDGEKLFFCCEKCAEEFENKRLSESDQE
jgi:YHS domain-containing protein